MYFYILCSIVCGGSYVVDTGRHAHTVHLVVEELVSLCIVNGRLNHHLISGHPVGRSSDLRYAIGQLQ